MIVFEIHEISIFQTLDSYKPKIGETPECVFESYNNIT